MAIAAAAAAPVVVKLGGELLEPALVGGVAADVARAARETSRPIVIVHGGGPQATALSKQLGIEPQIVGGRRVTDQPALDVVKMVVAGRLNVDLVAALRGAGVAAVGLHGAGGLIRARRRPPRVVSGGGAAPIDFGLVGDVIDFDRALLSLLFGAGYLPVIACIAGSDEGQALNINADVVASQLASALAAATSSAPAAVPAVTLVLATGVGGVRRDARDPASRIARLGAAAARAAIADGTVSGGMIPKLEEALAPLGAGVAAVHVVGPGEIAACLATPGSVGTMLVP